MTRREFVGALTLFLQASGHAAAYAAPISIGALTDGEKIGTLAGAAASWALPMLVRGPDQARWEGGIFLDEKFAGGLGSETAQSSRTFNAASDVTLSALVITPLVFTGSVGGNARWQAVQSLAATGLVTTTLKVVVGRQRPYGRQCRDNVLEQDCASGYRNESFPSGHASFAFTGAGLLCSLRDDALCPIGLSLATLTAIFRVSANQHYLTDVIAGSAVGWMSGYYLPKWKNPAPSAPLPARTSGALTPTYQISFPLPGG